MHILLVKTHDLASTLDQPMSTYMCYALVVGVALKFSFGDDNPKFDLWLHPSTSEKVCDLFLKICLAVAFFFVGPHVIFVSDLSLAKGCGRYRRRRLL